MRKSVLAGVLIAIGALFSLSAMEYGPVVQGLCFSVGLFGVMCSGASLFTGNVLGSADVMYARGRDAKLYELRILCTRLAKTWLFNLVGSLVVAACAYVTGFDAASAVAAKSAMPWTEMVVRSALCNVLVCLAVWTFRRSDRSPIDAIAACVLPVACFVACGFEHCVADMLYMPLGFMQGATTVLDCVRVIALATVGNAAGGVAFTWLAKR